MDNDDEYRRTVEHILQKGYHLEIERIVEEILFAGDPWTLSNEGAGAVATRLEACLIVLFYALDRIEPRRHRKGAFKALRELMSTMRDAIDGFHNIKLVATKQARVAQTAKRRKTAQRYDRLRECILAEAKARNLPMSKGIKFAHVVRPGVRQRMGLQPNEKGWPSPSTIKCAVAKMRAAQ